MKVESIAECILQYFWPALSDNWSWKPIFSLFESSRFIQVLLYSKSKNSSTFLEIMLFKAKFRGLFKTTYILMYI